MIIFLAGAESSKYQQALLESGEPSLQTFYAQHSIHKLIRMKAELKEEKETQCPKRSSDKPS